MASDLKESIIKGQYLAQYCDICKTSDYIHNLDKLINTKYILNLM